MSKAYVLSLFLFSPLAFAQTQISFISDEAKPFAAPILQTLKSQNVDLSQYREIRFKAEGGHATVYLLSSKYHRFDKMSFNAAGVAIHAVESLALDSQVKPSCPDSSTEFLAFAPNNDAFELQITEEVAKSAEAHGLKVTRLYKKEATAKAYLNYMSCPNLRGNFYDGDANPTEIVTVDGSLTATEMRRSLAGVFHHEVVNIWLACEAFNDPMRSVMLTTLQSQKYAAGYNDLEIGPSDRTAACAMQAALNGEPMTKAFQNCRKLHDVKDDHWGFLGSGSEYFGH